MVKLQKSIEKRKALLRATLCLIQKGGIQAACMSQVAKHAGVSPGTIYLYFQNKEDMINQLYLAAKGNFSLAAFAQYDTTEPVYTAFKKIWHNILNYKTENPEEASFLNQCDNTPLIAPEIRQEGLKHLQPLLDLWSRGKQEGLIKDSSPYLLYAQTIYPMAFLMNPIHCQHYLLNKETAHEAFQAAWDSIKV
ncbi:transcriptional regulator [Reichenbachiella sp. 5M10]|uniref:TetR/AcrR family transcriptional regulator n=1 Tax=Reichenbachiella sp. 5M10 TaxID=1889772 RepID=UPI000C158EE0|nr:TetR/AcrR family transcriptional regulator [Reichenbachiella sp. 5M10]PIB36470.1 transcriptional regulator [Reichenbachiella sp. 5M10]